MGTFLAAALAGQAAAKATSAAPAGGQSGSKQSKASSPSLATWVAAHTQAARTLSPSSEVEPTESAKAGIKEKLDKLAGIIAGLTPLALSDPDAAQLLQARTRERDELIRQLKELKPISVQVSQAATARDKASKLLELRRTELAELTALLSLKQDEVAEAEAGLATASAHYSQLVAQQLLASPPRAGPAFQQPPLVQGDPAAIAHMCAGLAAVLPPIFATNFAQWLQAQPPLQSAPAASAAAGVAPSPSPSHASTQFYSMNPGAASEDDEGDVELGSEGREDPYAEVSPEQFAQQLAEAFVQQSVQQGHPPPQLTPEQLGFTLGRGRRQSDPGGLITPKRGRRAQPAGEDAAAAAGRHRSRTPAGATAPGQAPAESVDLTNEDHEPGEGLGEESPALATAA
jgi:hypothetical protein